MYIKIWHNQISTEAEPKKALYYQEFKYKFKIYFDATCIFKNFRLINARLKRILQSLIVIRKTYYNSEN